MPVTLLHKIVFFQQIHIFYIFNCYNRMTKNLSVVTMMNIIFYNYSNGLRLSQFLLRQVVFFLANSLGFFKHIRLRYKQRFCNICPLYPICQCLHGSSPIDHSGFYLSSWRVYPCLYNPMMYSQEMPLSL